MKYVKNNFKKILILILALFISLNIYSSETYAEETNSFTIDEAVTYALSHNGDILKLKFQTDQLGYSLTQVKNGRKSANDYIEYLESSSQSVVEGMSSAGLNTFDSYLLRNKITEKRLERQKALLQKTYNMRTELVKMSVENAYYKVLMTKISYEDSNRNLELVKKQTELGAIKLKYGTISEMDYKSLEISQNAAELSQVQAEYEYKEAKMDLNELLGFDFDKELNLTSELEIEQIDLNLTEEKKKELRENNITFLYAQEEYDTAVENEKYAKAYYGSSDTSYKNYKSELETAQITYANAKNTLEKSILSTYNNLTVMSKTVKILSDKKDLMKLALGIQQIRLKYNTATEDEVIEASINYNSALNEYYETLMNYNMLVKMYEKNIIS